MIYYGAPHSQPSRWAFSHRPFVTGRQVEAKVEFQAGNSPENTPETGSGDRNHVPEVKGLNPPTDQAEPRVALRV